MNAATQKRVRQNGGWAVTLKSAHDHGFHPDQIRFNPFYRAVMASKGGQLIEAAWLQFMRETRG